MEEMEVPMSSTMHTLSTCHQCCRPMVGSDSNVCANCYIPKKQRPRSRSFTLDIGQIADKIKQSLQLPSPSHSMTRRKSMPHMNNDQHLEPPLSRPSSRASSFIEDVKQFLAPLSRKSSRTSLFQEFQKEAQLERKGSHSSILDAINICKPKRNSFSYERRVIQDDNDGETMNEIMDLNRQKIPSLRRKQMKQIESREERMHIYNAAYFQCMETKTGLIPWITKQAQKGPPDDWFGYTPPPKQPKKFLGIFKRKTKTNDLRAQQMALNEELLSRLPSLSSNSVYNTSPVDFEQSYDPEENEEEIQQQQQPEEYEQEVYDTSYSSSTVTDIPTPQPISILKKSNSNRNIYDDYYYQEPLYHERDEFDMIPSELDYIKKKPSRRSRTPEYIDYLDGSQRRSSRRPNTYSNVNGAYYSQQQQRRRRSFHMNEEDEEEEEDYYYIPPMALRNDSRRYHQRPSRRRSNKVSSEYIPPYMMEDWKIVLDDLCEIFPRLDRHYIHKFLVSAHGDFDTAKEMIMNMIMEVQ
ncbi:unnamed protein product [Rhizopus microsporus]